MSYAERQVAALLAQIERQDFALLTDSSSRRLAALVYVAEQYGFRFDRTLRVGSVWQAIVVRDERPGAVERAATRAASAPADRPGGTVAGMRPNTLRPLPEAAAQVRLLRARIEYDAMAAGNLRLAVMVMGGCALFVTLVLLPISVAAALAIGAITGVGFSAILGLVMLRKKRLGRRLRAAGIG
jgi:hypothetical protein